MRLTILLAVAVIAMPAALTAASAPGKHDRRDNPRQRHGAGNGETRTALASELELDHDHTGQEPDQAMDRQQATEPRDSFDLFGHDDRKRKQRGRDCSKHRCNAEYVMFGRQKCHIEDQGQQEQVPRRRALRPI